MSLVNLSHVCSHLQNASLARLGLTSVPYTKLHLSIALLLQKQGFFSQVKLGGPSPPASCFGQGPRDDFTVTNFPHESAGRNPLSPESALAKMIREGVSRDTLAAEGFDQEAIEFAEQHGKRTVLELVAQGWPREVIRWLTETRKYVDGVVRARENEYNDRMAQRRTSKEADALEIEYGATPEQRRERSIETFKASLPPKQVAVLDRYLHLSEEELHNTQFEWEDIEVVAGREAYVAERQIRRDGITIEAMGVQIHNQPVTFPIIDQRTQTTDPSFQDPDMMETEGVVTQANRASRRLWLGMKYYDSKPVLSKARMISKPTKRIWLNSDDIGRLVRGSRAGQVKPLTQIGEVMAVSTDRGIMEARECVERKIGGMMLCRVW